MQLDALYYGDCLEWMREWPAESVDLIYLDPPFKSNQDYNVLFSRIGHDDAGVPAQYRAFEDTWHWGDEASDRLETITGAVGRRSSKAIEGLHMALGDCGMVAYLTYMAERLEAMQRLLKPSGSIYLHCDPTASHYLKFVMDAIFGQKTFRNEIAWCYRKMPNKIKGWQKNHDVILYYSEDNSQFNTLRSAPTKGSQKTFESAARRGYNVNLSKRMATVFDWQKYRRAVEIGGIPSDLKAVEFSGGRPPMRDWWSDIKILGGPKNRERLGYPTQKPAALLDRIIRASSNEGDVILDPFCGCGTAIDSARRLGRRWLGIDISAFAIDMIREKRLKDRRIPAYGIPADMEGARKLAQERPFDFETWAVTRLPGFAPNARQRGDGGVDGRGRMAVKPDDGDSDLALAQIKGGGFSLSALRDFTGVMRRDRAALGYYITLDRVGSRNARTEASLMGDVRIGASRYPRLGLWPISDYFEGRLPTMPPMRNPYTGKAMAQGELF